MRARLITAAVMLASLLALVVSATAAHPNVAQTPDLILKEAQTVYFGNLARRQNGVPPLRWNKPPRLHWKPCRLLPWDRPST